MHQSSNDAGHHSLMPRKANVLAAFPDGIRGHQNGITEDHDAHGIRHQGHHTSLDVMPMMPPVDGVGGKSPQTVTNGEKGTDGGEGRSRYARAAGDLRIARSARGDRRMVRSSPFSAVLGYAVGYIAAHKSKNAFPFNVADRLCNPVRLLRYTPC